MKPSPTYSVTAVAGGSVHSLTKALAVDLAPIRVNNICAGAVSQHTLIQSSSQLN